MRLRVAAHLRGLQPEDVRIEFHARRLLPHSSTEPPPLCAFSTQPRPGVWGTPLRHTGEWTDGAAVFALEAEPPGCGQFATEVRIYPWHELLVHPLGMGLMKWL